MSFKDKVVWITGASSGIGAALAREFAGRGAKVILSGRDKARLTAAADNLGTEALTLPFDVRDDAALADATRQAIDWQGGVDIAVANAGVSQRSAALKTDMQVYRDIIEIDLTQQIAFAQGLIGHMAERGSGRLVFISSIAGKVGVPMRTAYCAAKFGLIGYADSLRGELSRDGVEVHVVCPGSVATDVSRNALTADGSKRGKSDKAIDEGIPADEAAKTMVDAIALNQREIIIARGMEEAMGQMRQTPDQLFDQIAAMVAAGYIEKMEAEG
ncbi:SDR family NAD(P)-dependent oxidoreductase [Pelagerythrobacter aerophilus]|uniref:SDR family NAD(P)-dependent oxidoreductase n=1 Tax=Pelagerythrobacter aerophilus TaxID=2306995 RepID=A0A418NIW0_9SPHN|nr:SDR family NAD(P)-dependent oxidoreductase [Pelagerythrobacter aerophilus]RIV79235.1 SDR family NAD(P)-dependent oxidoreductase [Pelagerythrobacter aerophilus]